MATQLENNTTELQAILDAVNALPEAGSSGGGGAEIEECTGTISFDAPALGSFTAYYTDKNLETNTTSVSMAGVSISVAKGTIVALTNWSNVDGSGGAGGGCSHLVYTSSMSLFSVNGDFTITYY